MSATPAIQLQSLSCAYGQRTILSEVSLDLRSGGFYAVMGANGCGKTTLLRCIAGMLAPREGQVLIDGRPLASYTPRQLAQRLSFVRQHQNTDLEFTAEEIVLMGRNPYQHMLANPSKADHDIVEQAMQMTNTLHLRHSYPWSLSGGELQRVMIARALAQQTPIMLLDEPTSNLDIAHQFEIMDMLCRFNATQGKTILLVVHDLNLAYRYCPDLILLHDRQVLYRGATAEGLTPQRISQVFNVSAQVSPDGISLSPNQRSQSERSI